MAEVVEKLAFVPELLLYIVVRVGVLIVTVVPVEALAVNVPNVVLFCLMVSVALLTVG